MSNINNMQKKTKIMDKSILNIKLTPHIINKFKKFNINFKSNQIKPINTE